MLCQRFLHRARNGNIELLFCGQYLHISYSQVKSTIKSLFTNQKIKMGDSFEAVVKDIGEVHRRLFDHQPFIQGEAKYLLREFEEKRSDREIQRMFEILENVTEIRETQADKAMKLGDMHLCTLTANLEVALRMCNNIVERESSDKKIQFLQVQRENRKKEWITFVDEIGARNSLVNKTFDEKEEQIKNHYLKLEQAMHISLPSVSSPSLS